MMTPFAIFAFIRFVLLSGSQSTGIDRLAVDRKTSPQPVFRADEARFVLALEVVHLKHWLGAVEQVTETQISVTWLSTAWPVEKCDINTSTLTRNSGAAGRGKTGSLT